MNDQNELKWISPADVPFLVSGFAWWKEERSFRRLPAAAHGTIRSVLDELANNTAGGQIRFQTNAAKLVVKVKLFGTNPYDHMPSTGVNGFDCYFGPPGSQLYFGTTRFSHDAEQYESILFESLEPELRYITLHFPLYQGVHELQIGLNPDAIIGNFPPYDNEGKIIIYGTSITQGGCASRPGMAYTNILSRKINMEFINLGFSGNGKGDSRIAELISEIELPKCLVLDYDANCDTLDELAKTMPEFIRIIRSRHPVLPILVVSRIPFGFEHTQAQSYQERIERMTFQRELVKELKENGDDFIFFCDGAELIGDLWNECTVDGVHPSDLGFLQLANGLAPILKNILSRE
ncbi:hypothetical protein PAT3040_02293 [Paenibacillus agaridevorans]|uniref:SGNH hydrolase-type esterase domain-containing protein n=1 Tax=Paenibacillus agaridevorans TaxID=171404 RepID=A0A2R5EVB2_9BACL|nr:SGNH/GDSL hydrolase family protein [Paenibacillus agaridevorans]GBG07733.1 hypothetical protein PAT3040_02293 [Paenibacillus agaridevorans]